MWIAGVSLFGCEERGLLSRRVEEQSSVSLAEQSTEEAGDKRRYQSLVYESSRSRNYCSRERANGSKIENSHEPIAFGHIDSLLLNGPGFGFNHAHDKSSPTSFASSCLALY